MNGVVMMEEQNGMRRRRWRMSVMVGALAIGAVLGSVAGCASGPQPAASGWEFEAQSPGDEAMSRWLAGDVVEVRPDVRGEGAEQVLMAAEIALWEGDKEAAFEIFSRMLREHPGHALNRYAALRLGELVDEVVDGPQRLEGWLEEVRYEGEGLLTRVELSGLAWEVAHARWERSDVMAPFALGDAGVPAEFRVSPLMSPWRLLDFDEA